VEGMTKKVKLYSETGQLVCEKEIEAEVPTKPLAGEKPHWPNSILHEGKMYCAFREDAYTEHAGREVTLQDKDGNAVKIVKVKQCPVPGALFSDSKVYMRMNDDIFRAVDCLTV
jgi:hypothetical protein